MKEKDPIYVTCEDHMVSHEKFDLIYRRDLDMLETRPQPKIEKLGAYYESEDYISHTDSNKSFIDKLYHIVKYKPRRSDLNFFRKRFLLVRVS